MKARCYLSQRAVRIVGMRSSIKAKSWFLPALAITSLRPMHTPCHQIMIINYSGRKKLFFQLSKSNVSNNDKRQNMKISHGRPKLYKNLPNFFIKEEPFARILTQKKRGGTTITMFPAHTHRQKAERWPKVKI